MNNKMTILSIVLWSIVFLVALAALITFAVNKTGFTPFFVSFGEDKSEYISVKEETITENVQDISIDWISGEIRYFKSNDSSVRVVQKSKEDFPGNKMFSLKTEGSKLIIQDKRGKVFFLTPKGADLEIYLPEKEYNSIRNNTVSADIIADNVKANAITLNTVSGDIILSGSFGSANLDTTSGDIKADGCEASGKINVNTTSGTIEGVNMKADAVKMNSTSGDVILTGEINEIEANSVSGDVKVNTSTNLRSFESDSVSGNVELTVPQGNGFTLDFDKVSGDFSADFPITTQNGTYTYGDGAARFKVDTVSGDFKISLR